MKKGAILNSHLNSLIGSLGHGDMIIICDAGMPIPSHVQRIDLALKQDVPDIVTVLESVMSEIIYEKVVVAEEQKLYNPLLYSRISPHVKRCPLSMVPHDELFRDYLPTAKAAIRTGSFEPWGNVFIYSGIDAPEWFSKKGVVVPQYYKERAEYREM